MAVRNLHFIRAVGRPQIQRRIPGTGSQLMGSDDRGNPIPTATWISAKYEKIPDRSEYTTLTIKKRDLKDFTQAVSFICLDKDCYFSILDHKEAGGDCVSIEIPGRFTPPNISHEQISVMCADYKLLGTHYLEYMDIFNGNAMDRVLPLVLNYLVQKSLGREYQLEAWVARTIELLAEKQ